MFDIEKANYDFWKMCWDYKVADADTLRQAVKTEKRPKGEISPEQFKEITGIDFIVKEEIKDEVEEVAKEKETPKAEKVTE